MSVLLTVLLGFASAAGPIEGRLTAADEPLAPGARVRVTTRDHAAERLIGRLRGVDDAGLAVVLEKGGFRSLPWAEVAKVETRGKATLKKRAWRGAVPGLLAGAALGALAGSGVDDDPRGKYIREAGAVGGVSGLFLGALVGLAIPSADWHLVERADLAAPQVRGGAGGALPSARKRQVFVEGALSSYAIRGGLRNAAVPGVTVGLFVSPELSVSVEGLAPVTLYEDLLSNFRIRPSTASGLVGLHFQSHPRIRLGLLTGLSRQRSDETYWSVTLGLDAMWSLSRHVAVVPQLRFDTEGGRVSSGVGLRPGIGLRALF